MAVDHLAAPQRKDLDDRTIPLGREPDHVDRADRLPLDQVPKGLPGWFIDEAAKNDPAWIARFVGLMSTLDWSERLGEIKCPTLLVMPGGETVGSIKNYDVMIERISDVQAIAYEGMPHNICDAVPDRCVADVLAFLRWRFGLPTC